MQYLASAILVPYVCWGIYMLRRKYMQHEDPSLKLESATLFSLVVFYALEIIYLRNTMPRVESFYMFAVLGLFVSGAALYGHMFISLVSHLIVDMVAAADNHPHDGPRLGPAEALERQRDYHGAVQEYLVLARMFPRNAEVHVRIADNMLRMKRHEEAAEWFERAMRHAPTADYHLMITNRLHEIYQKNLDNHDSAARVLTQFIDRYPDSPYSASLQARLTPPELVNRDARLELMTGTDSPGGMPAMRPETGMDTEAKTAGGSSLSLAPLEDHPLN